MQAIWYDQYGPPDVLRLEEVEPPTPKDGEVLVEVQAASLNSWDWDLLTGTPLVYRFWGLSKPKFNIPGADVAGRVTAVGKDVTKFQPGDEVYGDLSGCGWGAFAEQVCAPEDALAPKPNGLTFEQAAAVPQAGAMALQGLRDDGRIESGQQVLINGAGGCVGTFAVQIAKEFGAEVTGVDRASKLDKLLSIGADHVLDYAREDFTVNGQRYHLILDAAAHRSPVDCARALRAHGVYVSVGGSVARILQTVLVAPWFSLTAKKKLGLLLAEANRDLAFLGGLLEAGKVVPVIDRRFPLREVPDAYRRFRSGESCGKIVITMSG